MKNNDLLIMSNSVDVQDVPNLVRLFPLGTVVSQKGNFIVDEDSFVSMKDFFQKRKIDIVVDYEHQTLKDTEAPAGGWIKDIVLKEDGVYAKVEWTARAKQYIREKEYRYLSPVIKVDAQTKRAKILHSVALTNTPAIDGMKAIINSVRGGDEGLSIESGNATAVHATILKALQLPQNATLEEVLDKINEILNETEVACKYKTSEKENLVELALSIGSIDECSVDGQKNAVTRI